MCLSRFLRFNGVCGFCSYKFLVDCMFLSCFNIKFVSLSRPCFTSWNSIPYQGHVLVSNVYFYIESIF